MGFQTIASGNSFLLNSIRSNYTARVEELSGTITSPRRRRRILLSALIYILNYTWNLVLWSNMCIYWNCRIIISFVVLLKGFHIFGINFLTFNGFAKQMFLFFFRIFWTLLILKFQFAAGTSRTLGHSSRGVLLFLFKFSSYFWYFYSWHYSLLFWCLFQSIGRNLFNIFLFKFSTFVYIKWKWWIFYFLWACIRCNWVSNWTCNFSDILWLRLFYLFYWYYDVLVRRCLLNNLFIALILYR